MSRELVDREQLHLCADEALGGEPKHVSDLLRMDAAAGLMALKDGLALDGLAGAAVRSAADRDGTRRKQRR